MYKSIRISIIVTCSVWLSCTAAHIVFSKVHARSIRIEVHALINEQEYFRSHA